MCRGTCSSLCRHVQFSRRCLRAAMHQLWWRCSPGGLAACHKLASHLDCTILDRACKQISRSLQPVSICLHAGLPVGALVPVTELAPTAEAPGSSVPLVVLPPAVRPARCPQKLGAHAHRPVRSMPAAAFSIACEAGRFHVALVSLTPLASCAGTDT